MSTGKKGKQEKEEESPDESERNDIYMESDF